MDGKTSHKRRLAGASFGNENRSLHICHVMLKQVLIASALFGLTLTPLRAVSLLFDYTYDTNNFFTAERRNTLEAAGEWFGLRLADSLTGIVPSGGNTWTQRFDHPSTGAEVALVNPIVPADTLVIYVGARDLGPTTLGEGGPGGYTANGSVAWLDTVGLRGQAGGDDDPPTDFATWGGTITFDTTTTWYADQDLTAMESGLGFDLYSTALHEIAHVLGFGTALSFNTQIDFDAVTFTGTSAAATFGSHPPLANEAHWRSNVQSPIFGTSILQTAGMTPGTPTGVRRHMTELDMAALRDTGWIVVPEPGATLMLGAAGASLLLRRRRRPADLAG